MRSLEDIRDNLDFVGCDNATALELCDEIEQLNRCLDSMRLVREGWRAEAKQLRVGIHRLALMLLDGCRIGSSDGWWCIYVDGVRNDDWLAGSLVELVENLGEPKAGGEA
jgi:hypothetical protein